MTFDPHLFAACLLWAVAVGLWLAASNYWHEEAVHMIGVALLLYLLAIGAAWWGFALVWPVAARVAGNVLLWYVLPPCVILVAVADLVAWAAQRRER